MKLHFDVLSAPTRRFAGCPHDLFKSERVRLTSAGRQRRRPKMETLTDDPGGRLIFLILPFRFCYFCINTPEANGPSVFGYSRGLERLSALGGSQVGNRQSD